MKHTHQATSTLLAAALLAGAARGQVTGIVSLAPGGTSANQASSASRISAGGRFVAYQSGASNLVAGDTNGVDDIFAYDRQSATTERVSVSSGGGQANGSCTQPAITGDGRFVVFSSPASNLVPVDTGSYLDVFVHDRQSGTTERISETPGGIGGNLDSGGGSLSADGRFAVFASLASNLVPGHGGIRDIFVRDRQAGTIECVSAASGGAQANAHSYRFSISIDGRFVVFESAATNLVPADTNTVNDIFLRDRSSGTTSRVSVATGGGEVDTPCNEPSISGDGRYVTFWTWDSSLVPGDANGFADVYLHDRGVSAPTAYCSGDGSGTACPCGNAGVPLHGCGNSVNASGAILSGSGSASISSDTFLLAGSGMPDAAVLFFQGTSQLAGGSGLVFGDGLRCAGGPITRLGTKVNVAGASQYPGGGDAPVSVRGTITSPGIRTYQLWYRNAAAFCTNATFNLSNGLEAQWLP